MTEGIRTSSMFSVGLSQRFLKKSGNE